MRSIAINKKGVTLVSIKNRGASLIQVLIVLSIITAFSVNFIYFVKERSSIVLIKNKAEGKIGKRYLEEMENRNSERIYNNGVSNNGIKILPVRKEEYFDSVIIMDIHGNGKLVPLLYMKSDEKSIGGFQIKQINDENGSILQLPLLENTVYRNLEIIYEKEVLGEKIYFRENLSIERTSSVAVVVNILSADFLE